MDKMLEWAQAFGIQFFFTTHSETLLKTCGRDKYRDRASVVFLYKAGGHIDVAVNPTLDEMCSNLMVGIGDEERERSRVSVYSEDDVTITFIDALLFEDNKHLVDIVRGADVSAGIYKVLFDKRIGEFVKNIVVLDGDMEDETKGAIGRDRDKYYNFVCLPGDAYPENQIFKYFSKLSEDDIFWERGLRGYTKQKCFRDVNVDEKSKSKIKLWFSMQDDLRKNGRLLLVRRWLQDNPKVKEEFNRQFFKAYKKVMEVRGGY